MKCTLLAVLAFVAVASGSIAPLPLVHPGLVLGSPLAHGHGVVQTVPAVHAVPVATIQSVHVPAVQAVHAAPALQVVQAAPAVHAIHGAPAVATVHAGPAVATVQALHPVPAVAAVSAIQPGYVAANRGAVHVAPLPGNIPYASHHLNTAPAPGTH